MTIDSSGAKTIHMHIDDALLIADGLMAYEQIVDSVLPLYRKSLKERDNKISLTETQLMEMTRMSDNCDVYTANLEKMIDKLRDIDDFKDITIDNYEKKVRNSKISAPLKIAGGTLAGIGVGIVTTYVVIKFMN